MARVEKKRKAAVPAQTPLQALMRDHLHALEVQHYSEFTVRGREGHIGFFLAWLEERGITEAIDVTRPVLERYQRYLFHYRKANGEPLSFRSQHARLVPLRVWFKWMTRQNHILHNPASEIDLPRLGRSLPKNILSAEEVERVMTATSLSGRGRGCGWKSTSAKAVRSSSPSRTTSPCSSRPRASRSAAII